MWTEDCRWHYDYVRLAWDSGFSFDKLKQPNLDKNKICLIDIDRVVKERDVATVEQFLSIVIGYVLDNEQAEILDTIFVKVFRMSQLAVEYLLFCKRYLDNTVVLLKKDMVKAKEEIKELKSYIEDLEAHLAQIQKHNLTSAFKCDKCSKIFSTEDYLNSHIKRRHINESKSTNRDDKTTETDQLQSEIKVLKERLNVTEKMLKDKTSLVEMKENKENGEEVQEIYSKFEKFKEKVENEISTLHTEKKFYEDKYNRLFDLVMQMKNTESQMLLSQKTSNTSQSSMDKVKKANLDIVTFKNHNFDCKSSETDRPKQTILDVVTIQDNYYGKKEECKSAENNEEVENEQVQEVDDKIERKISEISSDLEHKISTSLVTIQTQMESFWAKLSEIQINSQESTRSKPTPRTLTNREEFENKSAIECTQSEELSMVKPKIKPRTKLSHPTRVQDNTEIPSAAEKLKTHLEHYMSNQEDSDVQITTRLDKRPTTQVDVEDLIAIQEKKKTHLDWYDCGTKTKKQKASQQTTMVIKPVKSSVQESPNESEESGESVSEKLSSKRSERSIDRQLSTEERSRLQEVLEDLIRLKFEDIGISIDWQGIPNKSFERGLEMIKHQGNMNKKRYINYSSVRKSIEKSLNIGESKEKLSRQKKLKAPLTETQRKLASLMKIRCRKKTKQQLTEPKPIVIIKQPELYQSESESDHLEVQENTKNNQGEFKLLPSKTTLDLLQNTDSDLQSITSVDDKPSHVQTKTNTVGLVGKKKVAFNVTPIDADSTQIDEKHAKSSSLSELDLSR